MNHYKDENPIKTVANIRSILSTLGIQPIESHWNSEVEKCRSVRITITGSQIGVNGKGLSESLTLASAYGELMERLQNLSLYPLLLYYLHDHSLKTNQGFSVYPDEMHLTYKEVWSQLPSSLRKHLFGESFSKQEESDATNHIQKMQPNDNGLVCFPYYHRRTRKLIYLPWTPISHRYGTNGMAAGNSRYEALVQAISEIMERYANRVILSSFISPPTIPNSILEKYFIDQWEIIKSIELSNKYKVFIKDCSLGMGLPVLAMILLNQEKTSYFVKFGAHPNLQIALERVLTETFQGRTLSSFNHFWDFDFSLSKEQVSSKSNWKSIFETGNGGYYSDIFTTQQSDYSLSNTLYTQNFNSNLECMQYLLGLLDILEWDVLIRDSNFLGFPSYHVIIPGISEISSIDLHRSEKFGQHAEISRLGRNISKLTADELFRFAEYIENELDFGYDGSLADITNIPSSSSFLWKKISYSLLLASVYFRLDDFTKAYEWMNIYIKSITDSENPNVKYYKCARDYFKAKAENVDSLKIQDVLSTIYGQELVNEIKEDFSNSSNAFRYFGSISCPDCQKCSIQSGCCYGYRRQLHLSLKRAMSSYFPDQRDVIHHLEQIEN